MKHIYLLLLLFASIQCVAQQTGSDSPLDRIDWTQQAPGALDLAYDWLDAVINSSSAIADRDEAYLPLASQADTIMRKLQRKISWNAPDETMADAAIYSAVSKYAFLVSR